MSSYIITPNDESWMGGINERKNIREENLVQRQDKKKKKKNTRHSASSAVFLVTVIFFRVLTSKSPSPQLPHTPGLAIPR